MLHQHSLSCRKPGFPRPHTQLLELRQQQPEAQPGQLVQQRLRDGCEGLQPGCTLRRLYSQVLEAPQHDRQLLARLLSSRTEVQRQGCCPQLLALSQAAARRQTPLLQLLLLLLVEAANTCSCKLSTSSCGSSSSPAGLDPYCCLCPGLQLCCVRLPPCINPALGSWHVLQPRK
jgi:hypothetical protein